MTTPALLDRTDSGPGSAFNIGDAMKTPILTILLLGASLQLASSTVISTGAVHYPVNMGPAAHPGRIPVGSIPCESNHGFGTLALIATPFPSVPGGWDWDGGIELNGNLPSAFGISVRPEDSAGSTIAPIIVHVRKQTKPAYSPYSKEQVVLATLRCLLDSIRSTPKEPLTVKVVTEDPADEALQRFSGDYLTQSMEDDHFEATPLPGCVTTVDRNGIREIVFDLVDSGPKPSATPKPLWIPFPIEGDVDPEFTLLPTWTGNRIDSDRLDILGQPWPVVQDRYNPTLGNPDGNLLTRQKLLHSFQTTRSEDGITLDARMNLEDDWNLADGMSLLCWAAVLSEHPSNAKPLKVILRMDQELDPRFQAWVTDSGWKQSGTTNEVSISTTFVWNPETGSLTKGFIPKYRVDRLASGGWEVTDREVYERAMKHAGKEGLELE